MPVLLRLLSNLCAHGIYRLMRPAVWLASRFATPQSRFRLAVSTGFLIAAVGFLTFGAEERFGVAQSVLGFFGMPDGGLERPVVYASSTGAAEPAHRRRHAHKSHRGTTEVRYESVKPVELARKSICVRLCDGFAFPVGPYHGEGDRAAHEATCQSECPGARTALYVLPAGSDSMADATQVRTGQSYSKMPDAFRYTTFVDESCSCHPAENRSASALLRDFTLRRGDAVMTPNGLQVFHGGAGYPFKRRDFVALGRSRDVRRADLKSLKAIERASLITSTSVASAAPPKPATVSRNATKGLEHQARN